MKDKHKKHDSEEEAAQKVEAPVLEDSTAEAKKASAEVSDSGKSEAKVETAGETAPQSAKESDDKFLRLLADFENFRKRTLREKKDLYQRANEEIIEELLPVLDHLDMALSAAVAHKTDSGVVDGFKIVAEQMITTFRKFGLTALETDGVVFDPMKHEAISHLPSESIPESVVITQVRKGYLLGDKLLRAAQVVVSSGTHQLPQKEAQADNQAEVSEQPQKVKEGE